MIQIQQENFDFLLSILSNLYQGWVWVMDMAIMISLTIFQMSLKTDRLNKPLCLNIYRFNQRFFKSNSLSRVQMKSLKS